MADSFPPMDLYFASIVLALAGLAVLTVVCLRLSRRLTALRRDLETCGQDMSLLRSAVLTLVEDDRGGDQRQEALETRLRRLVQQQEQLMLRDGETGHYLQAVRQAEQGASVEEIMSAHELTRGEAELIQRLHGSVVRSDG